MMLKLNILNLKNFLDVLRECPSVQFDGNEEELRRRYAERKNVLPLTLKVGAAKDYFKLVNYYMGDC